MSGNNMNALKRGIAWDARPTSGNRRPCEAGRNGPSLSTSGSSLSQRQLLYSEVADLADIEDVLGAAIDRVDRAELFQQLARPAKLADDGAIEAHLVDLAGGIEIVRW